MATSDSERRARSILWVDSLGGLCVGAAVVLLHRWIADLHDLTPHLILLLGLANLTYGTYSGLLATYATRRTLPPRWTVELLIAANLAWTVVCAMLLVRYRATASPSALLHLGVEGLYVGALAGVEWRWVRPLTKRR